MGGGYLAHLLIIAIDRVAPDILLHPADGVVQQASVDAKDLQVGLGGDCSSARAGAVACYSVSTSQSVAVQSDSTLDVYVHFILAGLGSAATVNGRVEILDLTPAPEPGTLFLAGLALLSVALLRRSI